MSERQPNTHLPASIEAAWGVRERPGKGPKPALSLGRITEVAVEIARREGLSAVSMARVAQALGASTMSLYRYVAAKDELLMLMVDAAIGEPPPPPASTDGVDWRAALARWSWSFHERLRKHTWWVRVPISGPPTTPNQVAWLESGLAALHDTGLPEHEKASVVLLLSNYVRSEAALTADLLAGNPTLEAIMAGYRQLLSALTDAERFPALHRVLEAGVFDIADDPDEEFSFGLERILDGIGARIRSPRS